MLSLALASHDKLEVSSDECERGGISYTVDTVNDLITRHPKDNFSLILGPDALADFPSWKKPQEILSAVTILAIERHGVDDIKKTLQEPRLRALLSKEQTQQIKTKRIRVPDIGIRAKRIRESIATGHSIRFRIPQDVEDFISHNQLYRKAEKRTEK